MVRTWVLCGSKAIKSTNMQWSSLMLGKPFPFNGSGDKGLSEAVSN